MSNEVVPVPIWRGLVPAHPADRQAKPPESGAGMIFGDAADRPQLTLHYNRDLYVFDDSVATRRLRGAKALVSEAEDGSVTIRANGHVVAGRLDPKDHAQFDPGVVVAHKDLEGHVARMPTRLARIRLPEKRSAMSGLPPP